MRGRREPATGSLGLKPIDLYPDLELSLHATSKKKRGTRSVSLVVVAVATDSDIPWPKISVRLRM